MDIYKIKDTLSTKRFRDIFCGVLVVLMISMQMLVLSINGWDGRLDYMSSIHVLSRIVFVIVVVRSVRFSNLALKMYGAYLIWYIITRPMCGDYTLSNSLGEIVLQLFFLCLMSYAYELGIHERKKLFVFIAYIVFAFYFVISVAAICAAVSRTTISLPFYVDIGIVSDYVTLIALNRNWVGDQLCIAFCIGLCLLAYQRKNWARGLIAFASFATYIALGLTRSRTSMIAAAVSLTMACMLFALNKVKTVSDLKRTLISLAMVILLLPCFYKVYDLTGSVVNRANSIYERANVAEVVNEALFADKTEENSDSNEVLKEAETVAEADTLFVEKRSKKQLLRLSGRSAIWYSGAVLLINDPQRLLYGSADYMDIINIIKYNLGEKRPNGSMHNTLYEVLMSTGLLGMLFFGLFVLILVVRMIKVFYSKYVDIFIKMLTIPIAAELIKSLAESIIVGSQNVTNYIFFLVAGIFLSYSYELFPEKKHWGWRKGKEQSVNDAYSTAVDETTAEQTLPEQVTL